MTQGWPGEEPGREDDPSRLATGPTPEGPAASGDGPDPTLPPPSGEAVDRPPPPEMVQEVEWQRLDPRMLLITPVRSLGQAIVPLVIALFGFRRSDGGLPLWVIPVGALAAVLLGLLPWFTTRYRFTDTQLQVRRGLLNRTLLTAPLDRVRSVDLESGLLHRLLRLSKVTVGTGVDDTRIELDALSRPAAAELRVYLLRRGGVVGPPSGAPAAPPGGEPGAVPLPGEPVPGHDAAADQHGARPPEPTELEGRLLARIDWSWLRYAPFSLSSLVIVAGVGGLFFQFNDDLELVDPDRLEQAYDWALQQALVLLVLGLVVAGAVGWLLLSTLNYVVQWWNLRLVREPGGTLRLTRGLLTTRSTTVEEARVRGVRMTESGLLRIVGGAELATLSTGVGSGGTTKVLPPCPRGVAEEVGHTLLEADGPMTAPLHRHGPAAHIRAHVQAQLGLPFLVAGVAALAWWREWPWWWVGAAAVVLALLLAAAAEESYRNLGHTLTERHLVSRAATVRRDRTVLERAGIIGWVVEQSWFQRRRGLATLVATTAAGGERVEVVDVPLERAVALAAAATPGVLTEFLAPTPAAGARLGG